TDSWVLAGDGTSRNAAGRAGPGGGWRRARDLLVARDGADRGGAPVRAGELATCGGAGAGEDRRDGHLVPDLADVDDAACRIQFRGGEGGGGDPGRSLAGDAA